MHDNLVDRFIKYVKIETRSDEHSATTPSTKSQVKFAKMLKEELLALGLKNAHINTANGFVIASLPGNSKKSFPSIGFIAHMDTADFNAKDVNAKFVENYDGMSVIPLDAESRYELDPKDFPFLLNYKGHTLITTDGTTLLGADDKAGIAEIITMVEYFITHPEAEHGDIYLGFGPDEEIGLGADKFDVCDFPVRFAYTIDGGQAGELEYESFNAVRADLKFLGKDVHPGTAKDIMVNALQLAVEFHNMLPEFDRPEHTENYEGFFHLTNLKGVVEEAELHYIIRDHDRDKFEERKKLVLEIAGKLNARFDRPRVILELKDQYYNMGEIIKNDMTPVNLAKAAMEKAGVKPIIKPIRGGTDGSIITFMGIPTPNIFMGGENYHGRYEFISVQAMEQAVCTLINIVEMSTQFYD